MQTLRQAVLFICLTLLISCTPHPTADEDYGGGGPGGYTGVGGMGGMGGAG